MDLVSVTTFLFSLRPVFVLPLPFLLILLLAYHFSSPNEYLLLFHRDNALGNSEDAKDLPKNDTSD